MSPHKRHHHHHIETTPPSKHHKQYSPNTLPSPSHYRFSQELPDQYGDDDEAYSYVDEQQDNGDHFSPSHHPAQQSFTNSLGNSLFDQKESTTTTPTTRDLLETIGSTPLHVLETLLGNINDEDELHNQASLPDSSTTQDASFSHSSSFQWPPGSPPTLANSKRSKKRPYSASSTRSAQSTTKNNHRRNNSRAKHITQQLTKSLDMHSFYKFALQQQKSYYSAMELLRESDDRLEYVLERYHENRATLGQREHQILMLQSKYRELELQYQRLMHDRNNKISVSVQSEIIVENSEGAEEGEEQEQGEETSTDDHSSSAIENEKTTPQDIHTDINNDSTSYSPREKKIISQQKTIKKLNDRIKSAEQMMNSVYKSLQEESIIREEENRKAQQEKQQRQKKVRQLEQQLVEAQQTIAEQQVRIGAAETLLNHMSQQDYDFLSDTLETAIRQDADHEQSTS